MLKIAKQLITKLLFPKTKHIPSRPSYHPKVSILLLRGNVISLYDIHHHTPRAIIDIVHIDRIYCTFPCNHCFLCHSLLLLFWFFLLVVILKKQPLTIRVLFIELVQVLRKLLTDVEQIVKVGDILTV